MGEIHLVTGEYPPQPGGVADYTWLVAAGLAEAGEEVHVWCPPADGPAPEAPGVTVHRELGTFAPGDLARAGRMLDRFPAPRRLVVQWVPHAYGYRSLNVGFCHWLRSRASAGDRVDFMVHEPSLGFARSVRHNAAALVHRWMTIVLLRAARRVWVAAPEWERRWRPYTLGRRVPFAWLPIPANVPVQDDAAATAALRARFAPAGGALLGHFGTYGRDIAGLLTAALPRILADERRGVLLMGRGGEAYREELLGAHPGLEGRVHATGGLPPERLSLHLGACDLLLQLYPAGVNTRRGSMMAGLSHALPIVANDGGDTEDLWRASGAVGLVPVGDVEALVGRVDALLGDPEERRRLGAAAGELYRSRFDVRHTVAALRGTN